MMNQIRLTVGGINYTVKSDESAEYLNELGDELELRLRRIVKRNPTMSTTMAAIMAALEASDEAKKAKAELEQLKKQLEKLKVSPFLGEELGNKNGYDLSGYRKMYACKKQIRIVYSVVENVLLVNILAIGKREDMEVYKTAVERV